MIAYERLRGFENYFVSNPKTIQAFNSLKNKIIPYQRKFQSLIEKLKVILNEMSKQNIDIIVLKGILFSNCIYEFPIYKKINDIDILVK